jgi:hypothetical protein
MEAIKYRITCVREEMHEHLHTRTRTHTYFLPICFWKWPLYLSKNCGEGEQRVVVHFFVLRFVFTRRRGI